MSDLTVLLGGARSGKSSLAVEWAMALGQPVTFVATSPRIPGDAELDARIAKHQVDRPSSWMTVEEELDLASALRQSTTPVVVVDCLTLWVSNLLFRECDAEAVDAASTAALAAIQAASRTVIAVTNEVGLGIVPADHRSRLYRDVLGRTNQQWVAAADRALFMVAGKALPLADPDAFRP
jgi:adenosyl cobinamide kinase/adenosyl cobinamide phosphate guanylyltransferase